MPNSVCLSIIERNEAHVLPRSLASFRAIPGIDPSYCIMDGGSTDPSRDVIPAVMQGIPGEVHLDPQPEPLDDFASFRNRGIEKARVLADWLFFLDADDEIQFDADFVMPRLKGEAYKILIKCGTDEFYRNALVRANLPWRYNGRLHECLECDVPYRAQELPGIWIRCHIGEGARSKDPKQKFLNDAEVLRRCLAEDPRNNRHLFYLAQSVRDSGDLAGALLLYEQRGSRTNGWDEETYSSLLSCARIKGWLDYPLAEVVDAFIKAHSFRPTRAETFGLLAEYLRSKGQWNAAAYFAGVASRVKRPKDVLFVTAEWYEWRAMDEWAIASFWAGDFARSRDLCQSLLASGKLPEAQADRVAANLAFAEKALGA